MALLMKTIFVCGICFVGATAAANPIAAMPGCDGPPVSVGGHQFFVDLRSGDKGNDGSAAKPWRALAEVLDPANHLVATSHI